MIEIEFEDARKTGYLRKGYVSKFYKHYLVFDVESKVTKVTKRKFEHEPFLWVSKIISLHATKPPIEQNYHICYSIEEFHLHLLTILSEYKKVHLIAHNTRYDFSVSNMFEFLDNNLFILDVYNPQLGAFFIAAHNTYYKLIIIDNINFFAGKLEKLGAELGIKKLPIPKEKQDINDWIIYCKQDVNIVITALKTLSTLVQPYGLGDLRITRAKLSFDIFNNNFLHKKILLHKEKNIMQLEVESYFGGRTEAFYQGLTRKGLKYYVDFNSLYPSVMNNNEFSTKLDFKFEDIDLDRLGRFLKYRHVVGKVLINTDLPIYPKYITNRLLFPVGKFVATLSNAELKEAYKRKHIEKVYCGAAYQSEDIFSEYVKHFHKFKQKYSDENKPIFRYFAKLMLNSLYGKFGQHVPKLVWTGQRDRRRYGISEVTDYKLKREYREIILNHYIYAETNRQIGRYSSPIIASEVTGLARLKLWNMIEKAGLEHIYYCDTDSLILDRFGYSKLKPFIHNGVLGDLELKKVSDYCEIFGLKDYKFGKETRHKGVPKAAIEIEKNKFQFMQWSTINQTLRYYNNGRYTHGIMDKTLNRYISKGVKQRFNRVYPWNLDLTAT